MSSTNQTPETGGRDHRLQRLAEIRAQHLASVEYNAETQRRYLASQVAEAAHYAPALRPITEDDAADYARQEAEYRGERDQRGSRRDEEEC